MSIRISILTILFGLLSFTAAAQEVKSDYEIQQSFKAEYAEFQESIDTVSSADSADALIDSINEFEDEYSEHEELLNKVLHPDSFNDRMEDLKEASVRTKERLEKTQERTEKLEELETQVGDYEDNLQQLNQKTDSLQQAMEQSIQSEKKLSGMVRQYRENLEQRDELILAFIDSMVVAYQQMDLQSLQNLEEMDKKSRLDAGALQVIRDISAENLNVLQKNADKLRLQDYMRMAEVQQQFETMWNRLGGKIQEVYEGENSEQLANEVNENLGQWNQILEKQTFVTMRDSLAAKDLQIQGFNSPDEFYNSLNSYLDSQIQQAEENGSEANYNNYQRFREFWNQVESEWPQGLVNVGLLDNEQMSTISQKVETWGENAEPAGSNLLVYLLGAAVLLAIILGVMLIREKQTT